MTRLIVVALTLAAMCTPASAQIPVTDPGNLAQAVLIAERTMREYQALWAQYQTLVRMSRGLGNMERYRLPSVPTATHDATRWTYGRAWL